MSNKILFIGAGNMGKPIIKSYVLSNFGNDNIKVIKPTQNNTISNIDYFQDLSQIPSTFKSNIIFLAFKPQTSEKILQDIKNNLNIFAKDRIFISIIAGKNIDFFQNILGSDEKIIRVMPNLPIEVNEGLSLYFHKQNISNTKVSDILKPIGKIVKVEKEDLINSLTPISGSGPALLFLFAQYLSKITQELGLSQEDSNLIVKQTIFGSAKIMNESNIDIEDLIKNVASKKGVTAACLDILRDGKFFDILQKSIYSGVNKAEEL
jgi:pyrroline-5-carboxylate reductase